MLQMKLQLGIMIFHHSKTSPTGFKVDLMVLIVVRRQLLILVTTADKFHGKGKLRSDLGLSTDMIIMISDFKEIFALFMWKYIKYSESLMAGS